MIPISPQVRILVAVEPVDFRRGIDGLVRICRERLESDPLSGGLFVFCSRSGKALRVLAYDGQGIWLCHKRLSSGHFRFWPKSGGAARRLEAHELQVLLAGGNPDATQAAPQWRAVTGR